ncbi:MAG: phospholipase C [Actinomycetota bacterium]
MLPSRFTRRQFLTRSTAAAAGLYVASCTASSPPPRPTFGRDILKLDTKWPIKRVVYLMLENRSFDNIFGRFPGADGTRMGIRDGREVPLKRCPEWLPGDLPHDRAAFENSLRGGAMDGFALGALGPFYAYSQFGPRDIPSYWTWAKEYVLSDRFFASMGGPSYPNHLFFIAGQAGGSIDNPENIKTEFLGDGHQFKSWGCDAVGDDVFVLVEDDASNVTKHDTCFTFKTVGEQLSERDIDWASYAPEPNQYGYIWQAYSAIKQVYEGELWEERMWPVDDLLVDIHSESLPAVSWIVPRWQLSDHPPVSTKHAHNWVTRIVNGIMRSSMWEHTAIFITWDEWGGLYDHVEPPELDGSRLGFRVPMLVISPYARRGFIDHDVSEFTGPLRFIADNWGLEYLTPRYEQVHNFEHAFDFQQKPRKPVPGSRVETFNNSPYVWPDSYEWPENVEPTPPPFMR